MCPQTEKAHVQCVFSVFGDASSTSKMLLSVRPR